MIMTTKQERETERAEAIATLKKMGVKPGTRIYTKIVEVSRSGMQRKVDVYMVTGREHRIQWLSGTVARATGLRWDRDSGAIVVKGCGFDAGFEVIYELGRAMFPKGSDKFVNPIREAQAKRDAVRGEAPKPNRETDGGYLLVHERL
jgi:hypothetical protein